MGFLLQEEQRIWSPNPADPPTYVWVSGVVLKGPLHQSLWSHTGLLLPLTCCSTLRRECSTGWGDYFHFFRRSTEYRTSPSQDDSHTLRSRQCSVQFLVVLWNVPSLTLARFGMCHSNCVDCFSDPSWSLHVHPNSSRRPQAIATFRMESCSSPIHRLSWAPVPVGQM